MATVPYRTGDGLLTARRRGCHEYAPVTGISWPMAVIDGRMTSPDALRHCVRPSLMVTPMRVTKSAAVGTHTPCAK
jgi:hypothetical protein